MISGPWNRAARLCHEQTLRALRLLEIIAVDFFDAVRVLFGDGWGLIRASNTQPVIVARYEALTAERLAAIRGEMEGWLRSQGVRV